MMKKKMYRILDDLYLGSNIIEIQEGVLAGLRFVFTRVNIIEKDDEAVIEFNYELLDKETTLSKEAEAILGDILHSLLTVSLDAGTAVFYGGLNG